MKKKRLNLFSEWAQIISAISVIFSLIYIGVQVRQNTLATQAAMRQSIADNDITYLLSKLDNATIAEAISKLKSNDSLSIKETEQLIAQQQVNFRVFENAYYQYQNELLEEEVWFRYKIIIHRLLTENNAAKEQWVRNEITYTMSFQKVVKNILSDTELNHW